MQIRLSARSFLALLGVVFVVRGIQIQCIYPPLEGPDEYQHIAYLVYLSEQHSLPVYGQAVVPLSLYPSLVENPHSQYDWQQTRSIGVLTYEQFYDRQPTQIGQPTIPLYQAQHPPLYYVLVSPIFIWLQNAFGFREAVYMVRFLNILLAAAAMLLLLAPLRAMFQEDALFRSAALAISLSPMFMIYISRVANDALALTFAGGAVWLLTRWPTVRFPIVSAVLTGILLGLSTLTKMTVVGLFPMALVYLVFLVLDSKVQYRIFGLSIFALISGYLIFTLPYFIHNIDQYGMPLIAQEAIINARNGKSLLDTLQAIQPDHLQSFFVNRLIQENLWFSGWTFLKPEPLFIESYSWILAIAFGGVAVDMYRIWTQQIQSSAMPIKPAIICALIVLFTALAAYAHALSAIVAWGVIVTPAYYVMVGYPAFLSCALAAARGYGRRAVFGLSLAFTLVFLATEYHSILWIGAPHWAHTDNWTEMFARLGSVHPSFLPAWPFFPLAAVVICLVAFLVWHNGQIYFHKSSATLVRPQPN